MTELADPPVPLMPLAGSQPTPRLPRVHAFTVRHPWLGPAVWVAASFYFIAQVIVAWVWHPPYSAVHNTISDLGNTRCGLYDGGTVCSPRHVLMNLAFVFVGAVMAAGSLLIHQEFVERPSNERRAAFTGFTLMAIAGLGAALVGIFPEDRFGAAHATSAAVAIVGGNLAILVLGLVLPIREGMRTDMLTWSVTALVAAVLFAANRNLGIGRGTMERIAAYPMTVFLIRFGIYISRNHYSVRHSRNPAHVVP